MLKTDSSLFAAVLLILAVASLFAFSVLGAARNVVQRTRRSRGFSQLELILVLCCIAIMCAIAIPSLQGSARAGRERNAITILLSVAHAEQSYHAFTNSYADAATLTAKKLLPAFALPELARGYMFTLAYAADTFGASAIPYNATTEPRSFWIDQTLILRFCDACPASASSAPWEH